LCAGLVAIKVRRAPSGLPGPRAIISGAGGGDGRSSFARSSAFSRSNASSRSIRAISVSRYLIVQLKDNQLTLRLKVEAACNATIPLSGVQTVVARQEQMFGAKQQVLHGEQTD
jgi:hypothetical protein